MRSNFSPLFGGLEWRSMNGARRGQFPVPGNSHLPASHRNLLRCWQRILHLAVGMVSNFPLQVSSAMSAATAASFSSCRAVSQRFFVCRACKGPLTQPAWLCAALSAPRPLRHSWKRSQSAASPPISRERARGQARTRLWCKRMSSSVQIQIASAISVPHSSRRHSAARDALSPPRSGRCGAV